MKKSVRIFIAFIFLIASCSQKPQPNEEEFFLGDWYTIKGDVEAYSFLKDEKSYIFTGTQGMHPVVYGTWLIDKDSFKIIMDNGTTTGYSFSIKNDTLYFNEGEEIYTRTTPLEVRHPEVSILKNIASDFSSLEFSKPEPSYLNWGIFIDSTQTYQEIKLQGFSISAESTLLSFSLSDLSDYIKDYGFESDTIFMSEICNGYWDNDQIVIFCTSQDLEVENDSIFIQISSGILPK